MITLPKKFACLVLIRDTFNMPLPLIESFTPLIGQRPIWKKQTLWSAP